MSHDNFDDTLEGYTYDVIGGFTLIGDKKGIHHLYRVLKEIGRYQLLSGENKYYIINVYHLTWHEIIAITEKDAVYCMFCNTEEEIESVWKRRYHLEIG